MFSLARCSASDPKAHKRRARVDRAVAVLLALNKFLAKMSPSRLSFTSHVTLLCHAAAFVAPRSRCASVTRSSIAAPTRSPLASERSPLVLHSLAGEMPESLEISMNILSTLSSIAFVAVIGSIIYLAYLNWDVDQKLKKISPLLQRAEAGQLRGPAPRASSAQQQPQGEQVEGANRTQKRLAKFTGAKAGAAVTTKRRKASSKGFS